MSSSLSLSATHPLPVDTDIPLSHPDRIVRFHSECVLIPESNHPHRSRRPRVVTKSYSLPLWKKRPHSLPPDSEATQEAVDREETHVVFKVPLPTFKPAKSRSPTRVHDPDRAQPLPPSCLVHREPSTTPQPRPVRRPSLTLPPSQTPVTVPLRACCPDCIHVTEESLKEGELWQEKFSRGARRRRSASLDTYSHSCTANHDDDPSALTATTDATLGRSFSSVLKITVDEVDQRRKSVDEVDPVPHEILANQTDDDSNGHGKDGSFCSTASNESNKPLSKTTPIAEEDEDQLFPLPASPRRSPNNSPKPSPSQSPSVSPVPSPNASTISLRSSPSHSRDSLPSVSGSASDESVGSTKHTRRPNRYENGLLTPDASPSLPHHSSAVLQREVPQPPAISIPSDDQEKISFPTTQASHGPLSHHTFIPTGVSQKVNHTRSVSSPVFKAPVSPPPSPILSRHVPASPNSPPSSPRSPSKKSRTSFSLLRVGADVLKGVSSISGAP